MLCFEELLSRRLRDCADIMAYELLFLPSFLPILQHLEVVSKILIIPKTTHTVDDIFNILSANTPSFRQFIMRHAQRF